MNLGALQLNWLRTFEAAARLENFSNAASELNMTQSAVSQQIRLLEEHLKHTLFHRKARNISLTYEGIQFLPVVQNALQSIQQGASNIFAGKQQVELHLEVNIAFAWQWLSTNLDDFCQSYPGINLNIVHTNWAHQFNDHGVDLAIRHGNGDFSGWQSKPILKPELRPYCAPQLKHVLKDPLDLLSSTLIEIMGTREGWSHWLESVGVPDTNVRQHRVDNIATAMYMARSGVGVFLCYPDMIRIYQQGDFLVDAFPQTIPTQDNIHLCYPDKDEISPQLEAFLSWIMNKLKITRDD